MELVHRNMWELDLVIPLEGYSYYMTYIDDSIKKIFIAWNITLILLMFLRVRIIKFDGESHASNHIIVRNMNLISLSNFVL